MLGLTFEKLFVVVVLAGLIIGPRRLPLYAERLGSLIRGMRQVLDEARVSAERDMGVSLRRSDWGELDPRQYDPRRIVRDAMTAPAAAPSGQVEPTEPTESPEPSQPSEAEVAARSVRPGQRYVVTGSAAHPRRIRIDSLPEDDPRRVAAQSLG
ncbi:MAG: hypothetical protein QM572_17225 [Nocardioides sp.]|uniref:hypothetical protein n=1 Tax=Nocardioides sp. TaxID=35761 RepID=UPI0039E689AC